MSTTNNQGMFYFSGLHFISVNGIDLASIYSANFSFKCHRETPAGSPNVNVFSVNAISFHPTYGTFSTAGSDGTFHFWFVPLPSICYSV